MNMVRNKMIRCIRALALLLCTCLVLSLFACKGGRATDREPTAPPVMRDPAAPDQIALVAATDADAIGCDDLTKTADALRNRGAEVRVLGGVPPTAADGVVVPYIETGYNLIVYLSPAFEEAAIAAAAEHPSVHFFILDGAHATPNLTPIRVNRQEQAYLMGAVSAIFGETGSVAFLCAGDEQTTSYLTDQFVEGAALANPDTTVQSRVLPVDMTSETVKLWAESMISDYKPVLFATLMGRADGAVVEAAERAGLPAIASCERIDASPHTPPPIEPVTTSGESEPIESGHDHAPQPTEADIIVPTDPPWQPGLTISPSAGGNEGVAPSSVRVICDNRTALLYAYDQFKAQSLPEDGLLCGVAEGAVRVLGLDGEIDPAKRESVNHIVELVANGSVFKMK